MTTAATVLASIASSLVLLMTAMPPAAADPPVRCTPDGEVCYVVVTNPGAPTRPGDGVVRPRGDSTVRRCVVPGTDRVTRCFSPLFGTFNDEDGCYYRLASPQPPTSEPVWEGHTDGAIWESTCLGGGGTGGGLVWRASPPSGQGATGPTPAQLAQQAIADLLLKGPRIGSAPRADGTGLVGLPVWLWTTVTPQTWGPQSATAAVPGLSVTATARAAKVVWGMGDGTTVTCTEPGTPYTRSRGAAASPDCGHRYARSSAGQPGGVYTVTATTTWQIDWSGGGESGQLTETRESTTTLRIGELQVLVS